MGEDNKRLGNLFIGYFTITFTHHSLLRILFLSLLFFLVSFFSGALLKMPQNGLESVVCDVALICFFVPFLFRYSVFFGIFFVYCF